MVDIQEHPEQQLQQYIAYFLTKIIRIIQIVIPLIATFSKEHPNVFLVLTFVIVIYMSWRIICNMYTILKRLLFVSVVVLVIFLFLRGFDQVIFKDLPLLFKLLGQNRDIEVVLTRWTSYLSRSSISHSSVAANFLFAKLREMF